MATALQPTHVSQDQLTQSREWSRLSPARKVWVTEYIKCGDAFAATKVAYPSATEKSVRCMSYELRKTPEIVAALEFYRGGITRDVLIAEVREAVRNAAPGSVAHQRLLSQLERLILGMSDPEINDKPEEQSIQTFPIGAVIIQDGKKYQVKAEEI
jgi:hypothetical protein